MNVQFTHPAWLIALPVLAVWMVFLSRRSYVSIPPWRKWTALAVRLAILICLICALAGMQWLIPVEGMNVYFLMDQSDSVPESQKESALEYINLVSERKRPSDKAGLLVFGTYPGIESTVNSVLDKEKIHAVVEKDRTDLSAAIRLGTAAFPETGQKRLVVLSDGNENIGDALAAAESAKTLDVSIDVVPLGVQSGTDVTIQKLGLPNQLKKGQAFNVQIFAEADRAQPATVRLYRNDQLLGEREILLESGKSLYEFPQTLSSPEFYKYEVELDVSGDPTPQNNRATSFINIKGDPRLLIVSADPEEDATLRDALQSATLDVQLKGLNGFPPNLAEMQSYDALILSNIAAGDLGEDLMKLLQSAVRDFGIGLICIGGDQTYAAGGYRGTPLEETLPLDMELSSKKVLPTGALAMVMHGMEFNNGNQIARQVALGVLDALGPMDELGVLLWNGTEQWLFPMTRIQGNKSDLARQIAGMNQGDLPSFQNLMQMGYKGLKESTANLKHMIIFSDGDPGAPTAELMQSMVNDRMTVSTILIAGHAGPETMMQIADQGRGRFYHVTSPAMLPQIFIKETAVILKSAISEEPFQPQLSVSTELVRGIDPAAYPTLHGYVAASVKPRTQIPLLTQKGDPLLAHWQYGLGRAVAFTSDAKPKWAREWMGWGQFRQFWSQIVNWSLRRTENADLTTEVSIENGEGVISVEALDADGNFRNFLNLQSAVVSPKGERETVYLEQTAPGRYEARFQTREVGAYLLNLMDVENGQVRGSQVMGASINYSPEFNSSEPNLNLLRRLSERTGGQMLDLDVPGIHSFDHDRVKTHQPRDLWPLLLQMAIVLFPVDVGVRRIQLDMEDWRVATRTLRRWIFFWKPPEVKQASDESLAALLSRRSVVRSQTIRKEEARDPGRLFAPSDAKFEAAPGESTFVKETPSPSKKQTGPPSKGPETASSEPSEATTTSRLLEAKRRAMKRRKED